MKLRIAKKILRNCCVTRYYKSTSSYSRYQIDKSLKVYDKLIKRIDCYSRCKWDWEER